MVQISVTILLDRSIFIIIFEIRCMNSYFDAKGGTWADIRSIFKNLTLYTAGGSTLQGFIQALFNGHHLLFYSEYAVVLYNYWSILLISFYLRYNLLSAAFISKSTSWHSISPLNIVWQLQQNNTVTQYNKKYKVRTI